MPTLTIKNVGPIKNIENLEINKVNVFMGPQSSGKSTIAKIISFCTWLEKKLRREGFLKFLDEDIKWINELKTYHRLANGYFSKESAIFYEGERYNYLYNCKIEQSKLIVTGTEKEELKAKNTGRAFSNKVIYIPAERNFVSVVPNLAKYQEVRDSLQDFIISWFESKRTYNDENKLSILNLDAHFHTDSNDNDYITHKDGVKLKLQSASSGLQSIVPLLALFEYDVIGLYGKSRPMSVNDRDALINKYNELYNAKKEAKEAIDSKDLEILLDLILSKNYINTKVIIEEPEQNLFPSTQKELIYHLLKSLDFKRGDSTTLTTHSPYILYALNNCMMGFLVKDKMIKDEEYKDLSCLKSSIDPNYVSVWEIDNGTINNIQGEDKLIENNYFDSCMKEVMDDYYKMINYYDDEDSD